MFQKLKEAVDLLGGPGKAAVVSGTYRQKVERWLHYGLPSEAHADPEHPACRLITSALRKGSKITKKEMLDANLAYKKSLKEAKNG